MDRKVAVTAATGLAAVLAGGVMPAAAAVTAATVTRVPCTTQALVSAVSGAASGATLSLAKRCTYVLTAPLPTVAQDLTINGNGATLHRSSAADTPAFTILSITAGTITLNRLSFTNGNGAITLEDLAQLDVTGGVFRGNAAANGGAIRNTGATFVQATGAAFIHNSATGDGGAIYDSTANWDQIIDCSFLGNTAAGSGGAIYGYSIGDEITDSRFRGNRAATGGALFVDSLGTRIAGTVIHGNRATGDGGGIYDSGGGIPVYITDSKITGNRAGGAGGGLDEEAPDEQGSVTSTIIADNQAADGGGINDGEATNIQYTSDIIFDNHASGDGGGINAIGSIGLSFTGTTVSGNRAGGDGGGIDNGTGSLPGAASFTDSTISFNHAGASGGGIYNQQSLDASGTQITGNRAADGGGGIYDDGTEATATLTNSSPAGNRPDNCEPLASITGCTG